MLSTITEAWSTMRFHRANGFARLTTRPDLTPQQRPRRINIERQALSESGAHLAKRISPTCSATCGTVANVIDCLDVLTTVAESADTAPDIQFCAVNTVRVIGEGGDCVITFAGEDSATCISNKRLSGEAQKVFFECIDPPNGNTGTGGYVDLGDMGHVCVSNANAGECWSRKMRSRICVSHKKWSF
jgi:hypothetical protein